MKVKRARAIYNELLGKPPHLRGAIVKKFAEKHFISTDTVYRDLRKYKLLLHSATTIL